MTTYNNFYEFGPACLFFSSSTSECFFFCSHHFKAIAFVVSSIEQPTIVVDILSLWFVRHPLGSIVVKQIQQCLSACVSGSQKLMEN